MMQSTAMRQSAAVIGAWYFPTMMAIGFIAPLILWYFIARRGSAIAKWIVVVFFAIGLCGSLIGLAMHTFPVGLRGIISAVTFVLQAISVWLLFRPDTSAWFGETKSGEV